MILGNRTSWWRRAIVAVVIVSAGLGIGAQPAVAGWIGWSTTDSFENPALWSTNFSTNNGNTVRGELKVSSTARTGARIGFVGSSEPVWASLVRTVAIPSNVDTRCTASIYVKSHTIARDQPSIVRVTVYHPTTLAALAMADGVYSSTSQLGNWYEIRTPVFSLNTTHTILFRVAQLGASNGLFQNHDVDDMSILCTRFYG